MKKYCLLTFAIFTAMLSYSQSLFIPGSLGTSTTSKIGIGISSPSEELEIYKNSNLQNSILFGNTNTGYGTGNGFLVGIESAGNGVIWHRKDSYIRFGTNAVERMRISNDGKLGIGTSSPAQLLDVEGIGRFNGIHIDAAGSIVGVGNGSFNLGEDQEIWNYGGKCFNIGTALPESWAAFQINLRQNTDGVYIKNANAEVNNNPLLQIDGVNLNIFKIQRNGSILIGKTSQANPIYKLDVAGKVRADEITVNTSGADFVFEKEYNLRPLHEVEAFIKENRHLPDVAPAKTMQENGVSVGEMNAKLLQKIEELTLYLIEKNKRIENLENRLQKLEQKKSK